ncbi:hypothetical protein GJ744_007857 [Endocarpon pusillum]|uniref:Small ribosomal subunit protein mS41 n=1 Tax=Endocarpon pusillum TaxID=364733 RepID=A0A8H7EBI4_9EURO|nr:hypothetical protein GJ744_007857 [Endocarpon pusillum]
MEKEKEKEKEKERLAFQLHFPICFGLHDSLSATCHRISTHLFNIIADGIEPKLISHHKSLPPLKPPPGEKKKRGQNAHTKTIPSQHGLPRALHLHPLSPRAHAPPSPPAPIPFVPDHATFLKLIGRSLSKYAPKFSSWEELFNLSSRQLRERGIEPARDRRYLLRWREKYRKGEFGIGGDMRFVEDGVGTLRVVEVPKRKPQVQPPPAAAADSTDGGSTRTTTPPTTPLVTRLILNLPAGETEPTKALDKGQSTFDLRKVAGVKLVNGYMIQGPYVQPTKGSNGSVATLKVQEGLWEHRRGHKVDGGERRKAEVRFKRGVEQRRKARV